MSQIIKESLRDIVYKQLHEMVENSRFSPGTRINVEELAREMGVSRTPLWQAISKLEKEGLIATIPNKGVFVQAFTPEQLLDLYAVREPLECLAAGLAVLYIDEDTVRQMRQNLEKQREAISAGDLAVYSRIDKDFHRIIYQLSRNSFLIDILNDIDKKLRPGFIHIDPILEELYHDHVNILSALRDRNAMKAQNAFIMHNERKRDRLLEFMDTATARLQVPVAAPGDQSGL
ncbi:GntR family transcriptional regulator [Spirochaetia bacterium]|nr:GntR family transcriptional regulator [Spirochaetia bacterium]